VRTGQARREGDRGARIAHDVSARVHDQRPRGQQRLDLVEQEQPLLATRDPARRGRAQDEGRTFDLRRQRGDVRLVRGVLDPRERGTRRLGIEAPNGQTRHNQLMGGSQRRRQGPGVELGERTLGLVEAPEQEEATDLEMPRVRGIHPVTVLLQGRPRGSERRLRPGEVARDERDVGLCHDTSRAGHSLSGTEGPCRAFRRAFALSRSPSRAIAMPRSASAGASLRNATRFRAPRRSPLTSARAAAVMSESITIPPL
jgi:hypothetical protein